MAEKTSCEGDFFNYIVDTFWASLPEQTADDLAKCKKDALNWVKDSVTQFVENEIQWTERHVENARRMRREYQASHSSSPADNPAGAV
jgi:hypothetical protein